MDFLNSFPAAASGAGELPAGSSQVLLDVLPHGVLLLTPTGTVAYLNGPAAALWGVPAPTVIGRAPAQVPPAVLPPALLAALTQPDPAPADYWLPHTQQWLALRTAPAPEDHRWVFWDNVTARHQAGATQPRSHATGAPLLDGALSGICLLEAQRDAAGQLVEFVFRDADPAAEALTQKTRAELLGRGLLELFPGVREAFFDTYVRVVETGEPARVQQYYAHEHYQHWFDVSAVKHGDGFILTFHDITAQKTAEQALRQSRELLQRTIDSSLDLVQVFEAVRDAQGAVVDFAWVLNNAAAERVYGDVIGQRLGQRNPGVVAKGIFDTFRQVLETGVPDESERHYMHEQFDGWFYQSVVKSGDGVTTTTHDISARKRIEQALRDSQRLLQDVIDAPNIGLVVYRAVRNEAGAVVDFVHEYINRASGEMLGEDFTGRLFTDHGENGRLQLPQLREVLETGRRNSYLREADFRGRKVWFAISNTPLDGERLVHTWEDVTARQQAEAEIRQLKEEVAQQATNKYRLLFETMTEGLTVCGVVRDDAGRVVDLLNLEMNPAVERQMGVDCQAFIGRRLSEVFTPGDVDRWLPLHAQVADSGEPVTVEDYVEFTDRWYELSIYHSGADELSVFVRNISARKHREQQQAFLLALNDAFRTQPTADAIGALATRLVAEHLRVDRCYIAQFSRTQELGWIGPEYRAAELPPLSGQYRFADFPEGMKRIETGPLVIRDLLHDPSLSDTDKQSMGQLLGVQGMLAAVLRRGEHNYFWCLTAATAQPRDWTEADLKFLENVAERTWAAMERAKIEAALRTSEANYAALFAASPVPFMVLAPNAPEFTITAANEAYFAATYSTPADLLGRRMLDVFTVDPTHPGRAGSAAVTSSVARVLATKQPDVMPRIRYDLVLPSGELEPRWWLAVNAPLFDAAGQVSAIIHQATNVTEQYYAEVAAQERQQQQAFLLELSDALRAEANPETIGQLATRRLAEHLKVDRCHLIRVDKLQQLGWVGPEFHAPSLPDLAGEYRFADFPESMHRLETRPLVIHDLWHDASLSAADQQSIGEGMGMQATLTVALRNGPVNTVWALNVGMQRPRRWSPEEQQLVEQVAERTWAAMQRARTETALRESEEKYRTLFESIDEGFCIIEAVLDEQGAMVDFMHLEANPAYHVHTRLHHIIGRTVLEILGQTGKELIEKYSKVVRTGVPVREEYYLETLGGWYSAFHTRVENTKRVAIIFNDITARKQRELSTALLDEIGKDLAILTAPDELMQTVGKRLGEFLALSGCYFVDVDEAKNEVSVHHGWASGNVPSLMQTFKLEEYLSEDFLRTMRAGAVFVLPDTAQDSRAEAKSYALLKIGSFVTVPFFRQGRYVGHIAVTTERAHAWQPQQIQLLQEVSSRIFPRIERARTEEALRKSEEKYRRIFEDIDQGFSLHELLVDESGNVTDIILQEVNAAFEQHTGIQHAQGKKVSEIVPKLEPVWLEAMTRAYKLGETQRFEAYNVDTNRWLTSQYSRLGGAGSRLLSTVFTDITERKQREQHQEFLLKLSDALRPLADPLEIQRAAMRVVGEQLAVDRVLYAEITPDGETALIHDNYVRGDFPKVTGPLPTTAFGAASADLRRGQPIAVADVTTEAGLSAAEQAAFTELNIHATAGIPLNKGGRWVAVLGIHHGEPRRWRADELGLLQETAERTWAALERARAEQALQVSEEKYRTLFESIDEGFCIFELLYNDEGAAVDWLYTAANPAFERQTGYRNSVGKRISFFQPDLERAWFERFTDVARTGEPVRFVQYTAAMGIWYDVYALRVGAADDHRVSLLFTDITDRKQQEQHQEFLLQLSDALRPGADSAALERAALRVLGETLGADRVFLATMQADGTAWSIREAYTAGLPSGTGTYPLSEYQLKRLPQWQAGQLTSVADSETDPTFSAADRAAYAAFGLRAAIGAPLIKGGRFVALLCVNQATPRRWTAAELALTSEATERIWVALERARVEEALAASEQRLRALITNLPGAAAFVVGPDLRYQLAGGEALEAAGVGPADLLGRSISEALPPALVPQYEAHYRQALAGQGFSLEHTAHGRTFISRGVPLLDAAGQPEAVLVVSYDITARKQAEQALRASEAQLAELNTQLEQRVAQRTHELRESRDLLHAIAEALTFFVCAFQAVRDEHGHIVDLEYIFVNSAAEQVADGRSLVGRRYSELFPEVENGGFLPSYRRVIETGEQNDQELAYHDGTLTGWFRSNATKLGDGVLVVGEDITARKRAEQERIKNLRLLEQAEAVAGLGSWDYDLLSGEFKWSDGMYHLFGLPVGQSVSPAIYLDYVVADDRPLAEQLVHRLTAGVGVEATLRLQVGEQVKTVRLKAVALRNEAGQPVRVLGVDLDISELQRLEADNLRLRLTQQQALFEAVQAAQEVERKRLAEGLHNGIGQILYATKLRLDRLPTYPPGTAPEVVVARREADQLLSDAIRQTRALSHELTPLLLEEFGLAAALQDICRKLSSPPLRLHCQVHLDEEEPGPLAPALQLALYRMAQELAQNIIKHAHGATEASLELETMPGWVLLRAEDNGPGFATSPTADAGLGLRSIRDRVALLDGAIQIGTLPHAGAYVRIRIPLRAV